MWVIVVVSIIAFILTLLESKMRLRGGMAIGFILITFVSAIRYNYGNDYMGYFETFEQYNIFDISDLLKFGDTGIDVGWLILCKIFEPLGFFVLVAFLSILMNGIYYRFIRENLQREDYWLAMFVYLFTFDFYVLQLSMLRQGLVIALFILSYSYLKKGKLLIPILLTLLSISFHKTAIIILPFILLSKLNFVKSGRIIGLTMLVCFIVFFFSSSIVKNLFGNLLALNIFAIYDNKYAMEEGTKLGIRALLEFIPFILAVFYLCSAKTAKGPRYMVFLSSVSAIIYPFTIIISLVGRLSLYFSIFTIATVPVTYKLISNKIIRYILLLLFIAITIYVYFDRFTNSVYTDSFREFKTIFSVLR